MDNEAEEIRTMKWRDVTNTFSEKRRHYRNTYLEICEVYNEELEVSVFSSVDDPYEIYVSYGKMYGIIYCEEKEAYAKFEEIKQVLETAYKESKEPSDDFINRFAKKYDLCLPDDVVFDSDALFDAMLKMF